MCHNLEYNNIMIRRSNIFFFFVAVWGLFALSSCSDDETYAEQKDKERDAVKSFLKRDVTIMDSEGDVLCHVGRINPISEQQFLTQDSTTNVEKNEYVFFKNTGVYMQIVRRGVGEMITPGTRKQLVCRFLEYNILGDSLQLNSNIPYWDPSPDIMDVSNVQGTIAATFNITSYNSGGAMYMAYRSTSVPNGWLVPLSYVRVGRQTSEEGIAQVRLIVPHTQGQNDATSKVYPCFYQIEFQETRN